LLSYLLDSCLVSTMAQAHRVSVTTTETLLLHEPSTSEQPPPQVQTVTLRLAPRMKKKVSWREDTVDNEHMQKKKSKICCIFHKDDDCDSDDGDDCEGKGKVKEQDHHHECNHDHDGSNGSNDQHPEHGSTSSS